MVVRQSVGVIGSGAVGSYYGGRLAEAGHDVRFLLHRDLESIRATGMYITSPDGDFTLPRPRVVADSREIGIVDWVICALKATSLAEATSLVKPCMGPDTRILALMNGLGVEDPFAACFGNHRTFGGLAFTCISRGQPGQIHHLAYGRLTIGHVADNKTQLGLAASLWDGSKVLLSIADSLLHARWEKLCWNIPFNGLCVVAGGVTTDHILADKSLRRTAQSLIEEIVSAGNADLAAHGDTITMNSEEIATRLFALTATMGAYRPSSLVDFEQRKPMEIESMFAEPLRRAKDLGVRTPHLETLTSQLRASHDLE